MAFVLPVSFRPGFVTMIRKTETLSPRVIDTAKPRDNSDWFLWDKAEPGFGVRVYPSGEKRFVFQYSYGPRGAARTFRFKLGDYPSLAPAKTRARAISDARREATRIRKSAEDARNEERPENDPAVKRQLEKEKAKADRIAPTVADVVPLFLKAQAKRVKPKTYREWKRMLDAEVLRGDPLANKRIADLTVDDLKAWHTNREDRRVLANRGLFLLGALVRFAAEELKLRKERIDTRNIRRYKVRPNRRRLLSPEEYTALGRALRKADIEGLPVPPSLAVHEERRKARKLEHMVRGPYALKERAPGLTPASPFATAVVRFLALSGWRRDEALSLRRDAVEFARKVAILDDTKTGRSSRPLGSAALAVLGSVPAIEGSPYFFPGLDKDKPLTPPTRVWTAVRHEANVSITLHGLRHAFTTVARELGYGDHVIARLVGHTLQGMTSRYGDVPDSTTAGAAERVSSLIDSRLDGR